jgi:hypothetical protein
MFMAALSSRCRLAPQSGQSCHTLPGTCRLEIKDGEKPGPARIRDAHGEMVVLHHQIGDPQLLVTNF